MTLIEVLMSLAILSTLAMLAARSIQQAVRAKGKIQGQIDDVSRLRDALRLIERDINLAYHHRDFEKELEDLIKKKSGALPAPGTPGSVPTPAPGAPTREAERKDPTTHFVGIEESVSFVTMNNARMVRNQRQADFVEVGYLLRDCKSADGKRSSKCLWRRASPLVDDDVTLGGDEVVLLENVTEFTLEYIGKGKQDWVKQWRSDKAGDAVTKDNFPQAVKVSLSVQKGEQGKAKKYSMEIVVPIHFPNNKEAAGAASPTPGATQTQ